MHSKYNFLLILIFIGLTSMLLAQNTISGKVYDKESGELLLDANLYFPEIHMGTSTNEAGEYVLKNLPNGNLKLSVTHLGFASKIIDVKINSENMHLNIFLQKTFLKSEEIIISGGNANAQHQNAIKIETVDLKESALQASTNLMASLVDIPGVSIITKGNGIASPVIRGLSSTNILVLNNGVRMENYQFSENHPFLINESGLSKLEIIKGPASLLYGSDAVGGVINLLPERPAEVNATQADLKLGYSSNSLGLNTNFGFKSSREILAWGIRFDTKSFSDYIDGNGQFVPNSRYNTTSYQAFAGITKQKLNLQLYYTFMQMKLGLAIPDAFSRVDSRSRTNQLLYQDLNNHFLVSKLKYFINDWNLHLDMNFQKNHRKLQEDNEHTAVDMFLQTFSYQLGSKYHFSDHGNLNFGYNAYFQQNTNVLLESKILPDYQLNEQSIFGLYQNTYYKKLNFQFGIRYDYRTYNVPEHEASSHDHEESTEEHELIPYFNKKYGNYSFSTGFTYHIANYTLLRSNFASAYRTPHVSELLQDGIHAGRYEKGNPTLESQRNYELDLSLHRHTSVFKMELAVYYNQIQNYIYLSPTNEFTDESLQIYNYQQFPSRIYGAEAGLEYTPNAKFFISSTYTFTIGEKTNGEPLPFIPQNRIVSAVKLMDQQWGPFKNVFFKIKYIYAFEQSKPSLFQTQTSSYGLIDVQTGLEIFYSKTSSFQFNLLASNLLDTKYIDHLSTLKGSPYYNPGRNFQLQLVFPFQIK